MSKYFLVALFTIMLSLGGCGGGSDSGDSKAESIPTSNQPTEPVPEPVPEPLPEPPPVAKTIELCTAIDGSGSMGQDNFQLQLDGLAKAVADPAVIPRNGTVTISVVQFAENVKLEVEPTLITDVDTAGYVSDRISSIQYFDGQTNIAGAIDLCTQQFSFNSDKQVIDVSTDGESNVGDIPASAAERAFTAGVDAINALGVGPNVDMSELNAMVRPQPASNNSKDDGFVLLTPNYEQYKIAVREKVASETGVQYIPITPDEDIPTYYVEDQEQLRITLPNAASNEYQYVWMQIPQYDNLLTLSSLNYFEFLSGDYYPVWNGGKTVIDLDLIPGFLNIVSGLPLGNYTVYLLTLDSSLNPVTQRDQGKLIEYSFYISEGSVVNQGDFAVLYELGCVEQEPLFSERMPILLDAGKNIFNGKVYFEDYDDAPLFMSIAGEYDGSMNMSATAQTYSRDNSFGEFELFRTDSFVGEFDSNGQLYAEADVEFQPDSSGCDAFIRMTRIEGDN